MLKKKELAKFQVVAGLSPDELDQVILCCEVCSFKKNEPVIKEYSLNSALFILIQGSVSVQIEVPYQSGPKMEELAVLEAGDIFGEMAFLEEWRRSACVIAVDDISVLKLDGDKLNELFERELHIGYLMMRNLGLILAKRLMDTNFMRRIDAESKMPGKFFR